MGVAFETYGEQILAPTLRTNEIVLLDNLSADQGPEVRTFDRGA